MLIENTTFIRIEADIWTGKVSIPLDAELASNKAFTKGGLRLVAPETLRPFYALKARARRLLERTGVQLIEGCYAVPAARRERVISALDEITQGFQSSVKAFISNYEGNCDDWRDKNPEIAAQLQELTPDKADVENSLAFEAIDFTVGFNARLEQRLMAAIVKKTVIAANAVLAIKQELTFFKKVKELFYSTQEVTEFHPVIHELNKTLENSSWSRELLEKHLNKNALNALLLRHQAEDIYQFEIEVPKTTALPRGKLMF